MFAIIGAKLIGKIIELKIFDPSKVGADFFYMKGTSKNLIF
jgi:hypothetical protein